QQTHAHTHAQRHTAQPTRKKEDTDTSFGRQRGQNEYRKSSNVKSRCKRRGSAESAGTDQRISRRFGHFCRESERSKPAVRQGCVSRSAQQFVWRHVVGWLAQSLVYVSERVAAD